MLKSDINKVALFNFPVNIAKLLRGDFSTHFRWLLLRNHKIPRKISVAEA